MSKNQTIIKMEWNESKNKTQIVQIDVDIETFA